MQYRFIFQIISVSCCMNFLRRFYRIFFTIFKILLSYYLKIHHKHIIHNLFYKQLNSNNLEKKRFIKCPKNKATLFFKITLQHRHSAQFIFIELHQISDLSKHSLTYVKIWYLSLRPKQIAVSFGVSSILPEQRKTGKCVLRRVLNSKEIIPF